MSMIRTAVLTAALFASAGVASAATRCGAVTHTTFGETRAYFQNTLGACRPTGFCSAVLTLSPPDDQAAYAQQFRIARPTPGAPYDVVFTAVDPGPTASGQPMSVSFGRRVVDLAGKVELRGNTVNEWYVTDTAARDAIVRGARGSNGMRWTYESETGPVNAWFALGGVSRALTWIDCIGRG